MFVSFLADTGLGMSDSLATITAGAAAALGVIATGSVTTYLASRRQRAQDERAIEQLKSAGPSGVEISWAGTVIEAGRDSRSYGASKGLASEPLAAEARLLEAMEARAQQRFTIQSDHYADARRQSTTYFYASLLTGLLGFVAILVGVGLALAGLVDVGVVTGVGGVLVETGAGLIFKQSSRAKDDAQRNLLAITEAGERDENRQMALIYAERVHDPKLRDLVNADLARESLAAVRQTALPPANRVPEPPAIDPATQAEPPVPET